MSATTSIAPTVSSAQNGDQWFAHTVLPHEQFLRNYLRGAFPQLSDPDDAVQECYLRLLRIRETTEIRNIRTFLLGIGRNVALETLRKRRHYVSIPVSELPETATKSETTDVFEAVSHNQEKALVTAAIQSLPDRCREIVALRALHGLSYAEIAAQLNLAEQTVRVQMCRGIRKCVLLLRQQGITADGETPKRPAPAPRFSPVPGVTT